MAEENTPEQKLEKEIKKAATVLDFISNSIEDFLVNNLKGKRNDDLPWYFKTIAVRYIFGTEFPVVEEHSIDIEAEIFAALSQEMRAEVMYDLITLLKTGANVLGTYDWSADEDFLVIPEIFEKEKNDGAIWAIVSPTVSTILQGRDPDSLNKIENFGFDFPTFIGTYKEVDLYINKYASHDAPIIIGKADSFEYSGEKLEMCEPVDDGKSRTSKFINKYTFNIDHSKISLIDIDVRSLTFL